MTGSPRRLRRVLRRAHHDRPPHFPRRCPISPALGAYREPASGATSRSSGPVMGVRVLEALISYPGVRGWGSNTLLLPWSKPLGSNGSSVPIGVRQHGAGASDQKSDVSAEPNPTRRHGPCGLLHCTTRALDPHLHGGQRGQVGNPGQKRTPEMTGAVGGGGRWVVCGNGGATPSKPYGGCTRPARVGHPYPSSSRRLRSVRPAQIVGRCLRMSVESGQVRQLGVGLALHYGVATGGGALPCMLEELPGSLGVTLSAARTEHPTP